MKKSGRHGLLVELASAVALSLFLKWKLIVYFLPFLSFPPLDSDPCLYICLVIEIFGFSGLSVLVELVNSFSNWFIAFFNFALIDWVPLI